MTNDVERPPTRPSRATEKEAVPRTVRRRTASFRSTRTLRESDSDAQAQKQLLEQAHDLATREAGLAVVVTYRSDGTAHASVVNAGVVKHPLSGEPAVGFVVQGGGRKKLEHLRARPAATVVFRSGWDWVAADGDVDLVGPDDYDCMPWPDATPVFHEIYSSAIGGSPADWAGRDNAIEGGHHAAVLVRPVQVYSNTSRR